MGSPVLQGGSLACRTGGMLSAHGHLRPGPVLPGKLPGTRSPASTARPARAPCIRCRPAAARPAWGTLGGAACASAPSGLVAPVLARGGACDGMQGMRIDVGKHASLARLCQLAAPCASLGPFPRTIASDHSGGVRPRARVRGSSEANGGRSRPDADWVQGAAWGCGRACSLRLATYDWKHPIGSPRCKLHSLTGIPSH